MWLQNRILTIFQLILELSNKEVKGAEADKLINEPLYSYNSVYYTAHV